MNSNDNIRELVVIGAGPGGYAAAFHAADMGVKVTLIDKEENPGGVCLYRGCIPAKVLLNAAKVIKNAEKAKKMGIDFAQPEIDIDRLRGWKDTVITKLTTGLGRLCKKRKIEYIQGTANFIGDKRIKVETTDKKTKEITFDKAVIASGAHNILLPGIPMDSEYVIDSTESLEIKNIPESMLVIGGGYIGLEQANIYARLGSNVTVVEMTPQLMPGTDKDLASITAEYLKGCFEHIMLESRVSKVEQTKQGIKAWFEGEAEQLSGKVFDKVLVAVGRKPNTEQLGLENTNVELNEEGFISVNNRRMTKDENIFAVGDVAGNPQFAHKAIHEGMTAAKVVAGREASFDVRQIPFVEYTELEVAGCGLSERQAKKEGRDIKITKFPWFASGRAQTMGEDKGLTKLILDKETGRVLGVGIVGADAGKLISEGALAVEMAAVADDLALTIHPHPTLSETLMEAAEEFSGKSIHL